MARFNLAKLGIRTASALVVAPSVAAIIYFNGIAFTIMICTFAALSLREWVKMARKTPHSFLHAVFGVLYVLGCFACCYMIRQSHGLSLSLLFVCMIWSSDIGAFFAGKIIGGPKMCPEISPNKTWAGLGGAAFFPGLVALFWNGSEELLSGHIDHALSFVIAFAGGMLIGIVGQLGDLMISFVKRQAGVKDSGTLIPGHGGLLDRIDSLLLAAPMFLMLAGTVFYGP